MRGAGLESEKRKTRGGEGGEVQVTSDAFAFTKSQMRRLTEEI